MYDLIMDCRESLGGWTIKRFKLYPEFNPDEVVKLIRELDEEGVDDEVGTHVYGFRLSLFEDSMYNFASRRLYPAVAAWAAVAALVMITLLIYLDRTNQSTPWWMHANVAFFLLVALSSVSLRGENADHWFFRSIAKIEKSAVKRSGADSDERLIESINRGGIAARQLFIMLQHRKRSWTSPPVISDRAIKLCFPLINIDIESARFSHFGFHSSLEKYAQFMHDAGSLVVAKREDLIPSLRERYVRLGLPAAVHSSSVPEDHAEFINPMQKHNRWSVISDYVYPLAPWLSFLVAFAALIVSVAR